MRLDKYLSDMGAGTRSELKKEIRKSGVPFVKYGKISDLSHAVGQAERSVFAITDDQFAKTILNEIMRENDKRRMCE